ncbi:Arabinanase/levansucrase/invertase [Aspergillus saccharolyticus JOP 1030-1]|uniref:Arabinanase/levansucrase/invertase n=1 Tax=Aspergillus saccharolyticus JOP 1030-1 TaxID=1450539 RepID=A0A318ZQ35_9EURO|nr:Arabinanase/levansucrase/invertase [Aspergillus saccharolyticus JOP 1030-1]PYH49147.1 Arabinanase/levansucrase/invertase [Aspergillus saccharolyticus JOP 1030-1]
MNTTVPRPRLLSRGSTYSEFDEERSNRPPPPRFLSRFSVRQTIRSLAVLTVLLLLLYTLRGSFRSTPPFPTDTAASSQADSTTSDHRPEAEAEGEAEASPPLYPSTNPTDLHIHDPSIIVTYASPDSKTRTYYAYGSGPHIPIHTAPSLAGPWKHVGTVLTQDSRLPIGDRKAPWAPTVLHHNGTYYCYYATSHSGCRRSAIGVATAAHPGPGAWTDGETPIVRSGVGKGSALYPLDRANAIDVSVLVVPEAAAEGESQPREQEKQHTPQDPTQNQPPDNTIPDKYNAYITFGSFWTGIWQLPLTPTLLSTDYTGNSEVRHLAHEPRAIHPPNKKSNGLCGDPTGMHPVEGPFISFRAPWYYLWFSWGKCCGFQAEKLPKAGLEYSIRVGRSKSPRGPFVDKNGIDLVAGGGEIVYASTGEVYAPGGQGILVQEDGKGGEEDVLYYHYLNKTVGYDFHDAQLGYNILTYIDGWPVPV